MPTNDLPLPLKTLVEVAEMLRDRLVTSEALTMACLAHITTHEPRLHAFATLTAETALAEARAADVRTQPIPPGRHSASIQVQGEISCNLLVLTGRD